MNTTSDNQNLVDMELNVGTKIVSESGSVLIITRLKPATDSYFYAVRENGGIELYLPNIGTYTLKTLGGEKKEKPVFDVRTMQDYLTAPDSDDYADCDVAYRDVLMDLKKPDYLEGEIIKSDRMFGVELEFTIDSEYGRELSHNLPSCVGVSSDGSISGWGLEIQTPPLAGRHGEKLIEVICDEVSGSGGEINSSCGFHLHVDCSDVFKMEGYSKIDRIKRIWVMYLAYEDVLLSFVPKSRRGNQYCTPLGVDYHIKEIATASTLGQLEKIWYRVRTQKDSDKRKSIGKDKTRYRNINMHTFFSDGHIEIRLHSGTINPDKIKHWTALHTAIVDYAVKEMYSLNGAITAFSEIDLSKKTTDLLEKIKVEKSTKDYFISRQKELQDNSLIIN